jgi:hypothetical protein
LEYFGVIDLSLKDLYFDRKFPDDEIGEIPSPSARERKLEHVAVPKMLRNGDGYGNRSEHIPLAGAEMTFSVISPAEGAYDVSRHIDKYDATRIELGLSQADTDIMVLQPIGF